MKWFLFSIFLFPFLLSAQNTEIDSLKLLLKNGIHDTTRVNLLLEIADYYYYYNVDSIFPICENVIRITEKNLSELPTNNNQLLNLFYLKNQSVALNDIGGIYSLQGKYSKSLESNLKALTIQEKIDYKYGIAYSMNEIGVVYKYQGNIEKALYYYHNSLKIQKEIADKEGMANSLNNIGRIYYDQGDISTALEYYFKALKTVCKYKYKQKSRIQVRIFLHF